MIYQKFAFYDSFVCFYSSISTSFRLGNRNDSFDHPVELSKVILHPLYINMGLMKNFVKTRDKEGEDFKHRRNILLQLSEA